MAERSMMPNVLASRYASTRMIAIWSPEGKNIRERNLWLAVLKAQAELGLDGIPQGAIAAYERTLPDIDFALIDRLERELRHDVLAKIRAWNTLAGYECIHRGMTSRDLTDNVEQMQMRDALVLILQKLIAVMNRLAKRAVEYRDVPLMARTHNVPAQIITLGKRFATAIDALSDGCVRGQTTLDMYRLRGIKGPTGTQQDMLDLFAGDMEKVAELERRVMRSLDFESCFTSVGQIYPRSADLGFLSVLVHIGADISSFVTTLRLMAGQELSTEGFSKTQAGSSAMPHKMNARTCERITGLYHILCGYQRMIEGVAGGMWNEGDVSCSVVRRVALPDAFFAMDGMLEALLTVLDEFGVFPNMIEREIESQLPFLATTKILMAATKAGMGREEAHACIKKHAVAVVKRVRDGKGTAHELLVRLGNDDTFPLDGTALGALLGFPIEFSGLAREQTDELVAMVEDLCRDDPESAAYNPEPIL